MALFVIGVLLVLAAAAYAVFAAIHNRKARAWRKEDGGYRPDMVPMPVALIPLVAGIALAAPQFLYAQDAGEVAVVRNLGGSIAGSSSDAGFHAKAPWQSVVRYDTRNNVVSFVGDGGEDYFGGSANGPQVTVNDSGGASADVDVQVVYSLDPRVAEELYRDYGTQESFVRAVVAVDVRSVPREVAGRFSTIDILTNRGEFTSAVHDELAARWEGYGLNVESVDVQEVRYPESITDRYADAQAAEIAQARAENEQETARIEAETRVIEAQGEADANAVLAESLTPEVIRQHYIDALAEIGRSGNLVVVPEGSQPIVGTEGGDEQ